MSSSANSDSETTDLISSSNNSSVCVDAESERVRQFIMDLERDLNSVGRSPIYEGMNASFRNLRDYHLDDRSHPQNIYVGDDEDVILDMSQFPIPRPGPILHRRNALDSRAAIVDVIDLCSPVANRPRGRHSIRRHTHIGNGIAHTNQPEIISVDLSNTSPLAMQPPITKPRLLDMDLTTDSSNEDVPKVQCPICLDSALKNSPTTTKCGHVFCNSCITPWVTSHRQCPLCKSRQTSRSLVRMYL